MAIAQLAERAGVDGLVDRAHTAIGQGKMTDPVMPAAEDAEDALVAGEVWHIGGIGRLGEEIAGPAGSTYGIRTVAVENGKITVQVTGKDPDPSHHSELLRRDVFFTKQKGIAQPVGDLGEPDRVFPSRGVTIAGATPAMARLAPRPA